jgi:hypothetical protein
VVEDIKKCVESHEKENYLVFEWIHTDLKTNIDEAKDLIVDYDHGSTARVSWIKDRNHIFELQCSNGFVNCTCLRPSKL